MVSDRIPVGGDGNWDYASLQAEQHRLYVAHQDRMVVIVLLSRTEIRSIPGQEIHGVALVPELNRWVCQRWRRGKRHPLRSENFGSK